MNEVWFMAFTVLEKDQENENIEVYVLRFEFMEGFTPLSYDKSPGTRTKM